MSHRLEQISVRSEALGFAGKATLLVPEDAGPDRRYPVLYLLHSLADDHTTWSRVGRLQARIVDVPLLVVMPDGDRSFYINTADGRRYEHYIASELVAAIDGRFPTIARRACRAIGGPSMGGYGALMLALRHRDTFGMAFSQSGAMDAPRWVQDSAQPGVGGSVFGPADGPLRDEYSLQRLVLLPGQLPALYFDCGLNDWLLAENRAFRQFLRDHDVPHEYREHLDEHAGSYWNDQTPYALEFVLRHLAADPSARPTLAR